ncbi:MAG: site-specific integrase, partial [Clostridia bacterium]|nr:site-specific integrase [Clostridia bacterium]
MPSKFKERVCIGFDAQGNPVYKWVCGVTRQEIIREAARVLLQYGLIEGQQTQKPPDSPFFKTYIAEWFRLYKENKLRHTTKTGYLNLIQKYIIPYFGDMRLEDINTSVLQGFYNAHSDMAQSTVRQMGIILHQVFDLAVEDDYMKKNPANSKRIFISAKKAAKREALGEEHIVQIMAALPRLQETDRLVMALLLFTGLRRGEVLGLRWEDIDWARGMIRVERAVTFKDNRPHLGPPKSEAGNRIVPMTKELMQILKPLRHLGGFIIGGSEPISEMTFKR